MVLTIKQADIPSRSCPIKTYPNHSSANSLIPVPKQAKQLAPVNVHLNPSLLIIGRMNIATRILPNKNVVDVNTIVLLLISYNCLIYFHYRVLNWCVGRNECSNEKILKSIKKKNDVFVRMLFKSERLAKERFSSFLF